MSAIRFCRSLRPLNSGVRAGPAYELRAACRAGRDKHGMLSWFVGLVVVIGLNADDNGVVFQGVGKRERVSAAHGGLVDLHGHVQKIIVPGGIPGDVVDSLAHVCGHTPSDFAVACARTGGACDSSSAVASIRAYLLIKPSPYIPNNRNEKTFNKLVNLLEVLRWRIVAYIPCYVKAKSGERSNVPAG